MKLAVMGTAASFALLLSAAQVGAVTINVDSFDTDQRVSDQPGLGNVATSTVAADSSEIIGGSRTLTVANTAADGDPIDATSLEVFNGFLAFSNNDGARGRGTLRYDGGGTGLGNLVIGTDPFFTFNVRRFDNGGNVNIMVNGTDGGGNMISYMENVASGMFDPNLRFTQFTGFEDFDFTNVASLDFIVDTTDTQISVDGSLDSITLTAGDFPPAVPLPASALLLLGGLGGLSVLRRRKQT